ncbi:MAG: TonB-dependent siderophore receptor [Pseudomonadota bacterium]
MKATKTKTLMAMLLTSTAIYVAPAMAQETDEDEERTLETITVSGDAEFFRPTEATSATKIPLPIVETPQAITVLTEDIITLTGIRDLEDASGLVPGFVAKGTYGGFDNRFSARGFDLSVAEGILINGVQVASNVDRDFIGVERIEYLRGPTSIVLGTVNYGGAVNIITKRPTDSFVGSIAGEVGSWDLYRIQGEFGGPLNESGTIRGYAAAAYEERGDFREGAELEKLPIRAALDIDLGPNTLFTLDLSAENGDGNPTGTFSRDYARNDPLPTYVPIDWNPCGLVDGCFTDYSNREATANLRHDFENNTYVRGTYGFASTDRQHKFISFLGGGFPSLFFTGTDDVENDGPYGFWYTYDDTDTYETYFAEFAFGGEFEAFGQEHDFLLLAESRDRKITEDYQLQDPDTFFAQYANYLDPTRDFGSGDVPIFVQETFAWDRTIRKEDSIALTAQLVLRPVERLQVLLGVRYEEEETFLTGINNGGDEGPFGSSRTIDPPLEYSIDDTVFRGGIVYEVLDNVFAYGSYSEGFIPVAVNDLDGNQATAETGTQIEGGVKGEFFDGRLGAGISVFEIERDDVASTTGDGVFAEPSSRSQEHRGFEIEIIGEVTEGLDIIATYANLETEITKDDAEIDPETGIAPTVGNEIPNAPNDQFSLFVQYQLPFEFENIEGVSIGGGVQYVSETWDSEDNEFELPDYTLIDANLNVQIKENLAFQLIGRNLGDEEYFQSFLGSGFAGWAWGQPRSVLARLTLDF